MAEQVSEDDRVEMRRAPGHNRYDWDAWSNGQQWAIVEGLDFDVSPESMVGNIHSAARRMRDGKGRRTHRANTTSKVIESGKHKGKTKIWFEFVKLSQDEKRRLAEEDAQRRSA